MAQQDVWALFALLESSDKRTLDEVKVLIHENLHTSREPMMVYNLVDYYIASQSQASIDILMGIREPHDKALFDKLNEYMRASTRLHVLTLLGYIVRKQPSWLHKVVQHPLISTIIRCLKHDTDVPVLMSACLIVSTLLPVVPVGFAHLLHDVFAIFARLASFSVKKPANVPDVFVVHLQVGVYALFHRLYGMYPCAFLAFLRNHYSKKENIVVFDQIVKPMLERVRVHPLLITGSKDWEVSTKRWKRMEIHDIVIECAKLSLDVIEGTIDSEQRPVLPFRTGVKHVPSHNNFSTPGTPAPDTGQQFFSSSLVNDQSWHVALLAQAGAPGPHDAPAGQDGGALRAPDDGWTPSHSCGLNTPPPEMTSHNDSDFVHISPLPSGTPSPASHSYSSAPTTPADHSHNDTDNSAPRASPSKSGRRKTLPVVPSQSLPQVDDPHSHESKTLVKRLSLEAQKDAMRESRGRSESGRFSKTRSEDGTPGSNQGSSQHLPSSNQGSSHHLAKSDSLGLLTGGYRSDRDSGSGSRTPDPGPAVRDESLPSVLETSLTTSDKCDNENETDDQKSCDILTAQSANIFLRQGTRPRYTSMTLDCSRPDSELTRPRCQSMPSMREHPEQVESKIEMSPRRISQSSNDIKESSPQPKEESWTVNRPRMPYEDLFPSALPYAPISQCQRCLDRSYAVPDYSAPVDVHRSGSSSQRVLGLEIPLFSTLAPTELLDRHLTLGSSLHPTTPDTPITSRGQTEWTHFGGGSEEVSQLRAQVSQLHAQLMYERHRREQHATRNRRLLGKITHTAAVEEQNNAMKEQLLLQESEINHLRTALDSLQYEYSEYKDKRKEMDLANQEQLSDLRREKENLSYQNTELTSKLDRQKLDHTKLLNEFKTLKSELFTHRQELVVAEKKLARHGYLVEQVSSLNKELLLMGELQNRYKEQLNSMTGKNGRFTEHAQLLAPYKMEAEGLREKNQSISVQLEAAVTRLRDLEEQIANKDRVITDQKRASELLKSSHKSEVDLINCRNRSLQKIIHRLEQEIMDLFSKLHQQRNDERGRSRHKISPSVSKEGVSEQSPSTPIQIGSPPPAPRSPPPDHVTQFTPDVSSSLSPSDLHSNRLHSNRLKTQRSNQKIAENSPSNGHKPHSNERIVSGSKSPSDPNLSNQKSNDSDVLPSNENIAVRKVPSRHISVSIPTNHESRSRVETSQNHSYPTILPTNFDYTAWRSEMELMKASSHDRPRTLDYDHDAQHVHDDVTQAMTSRDGATSLVDSGLHESKSE